MTIHDPRLLYAIESLGAEALDNRCVRKRAGTCTSYE
jgi:hypothetical protein